MKQILTHPLTALLWLVLALSGARLAQYAWAVASFPYQVEAREGATVRSSMCMAQGKDPWAPENAIQDMNVHGVAEPWLASKLFGPRCYDVHLHRILAMLTLLLGALLGWKACRALGADALGSVAGALAWTAANCQFIGPSARNDALAALLYLAPLAIWVIRPSLGGLLLGGCLVALAPFSKLYAGLAGPLVAGALLLQGRPRMALYFSAAVALAFGALALGVHGAYPLYWHFMGLNAGEARPGFEYAWIQSRDYFFGFGWPLTLAALLGLRAAWAQSRGKALLLQTAAVFALLIGWMARNPGAYLEYYVQLGQPLLLLSAFAAPMRGAARTLRNGLVVLAAVLAVLSSTWTIRRFGPVAYAQAAALGATLNAAQAPLLPPVFTLWLSDRGLPIEDNGHSSGLMGFNSGPLRAEALRNDDRWRERLRAGRVDLVLLPAGASPLEDPATPFDGVLQRYALVERTWMPVPLDRTGVEFFRVLKLRPTIHR